MFASFTDLIEVDAKDRSKNVSDKWNFQRQHQSEWFY